MKKTALIFLLAFLFNTSESFGQLANLPMLHDSVYSEILKEERGFDVVLPAKYDPQSPEKYEMIYVMDAEWSTRIASNIYEFLSIDFMSQSIVIGVNNTPSGKESFLNDKGCISALFCFAYSCMCRCAPSLTKALLLKMIEKH
jgi:hypothetical protein